MHKVGRTPHILVAEDDPDDRMLIREAFEESFPECSLSFAHNGVELMALLDRVSETNCTPDENAPDLILLDLNMPLKDGRKALQEIKSDPRLSHLVVVVMTTSSNADDAAFCRHHGANSYIVKPTKYTELTDIVASLKRLWMSQSRLSDTES